MYTSQEFTNVPILYNIHQLVKLNTWNGKAHPIFTFGTIKFLKIDSINMTSLLLCMVNFIRNRGVKCNMVNNVKQLQGFSQIAWEFILSIYKLG